MRFLNRQTSPGFHLSDSFRNGFVILLPTKRGGYLRISRWFRGFHQSTTNVFEEWTRYHPASCASSAKKLPLACKRMGMTSDSLFK